MSDFRADSFYMKKIMFFCVTGSGSFYQQAKKKKKTWFLRCIGWLLYDFLYLKNDENVPSNRNKHKNLREKNFVVDFFKVTDEKSRIRIHIRIR